MFRSSLVLCACLILLGFNAAFAQQTALPKVPSVVSGGVLNGKAKNLAKPEYPAAAKAVNAEGAVNVQVTIDEEGNVISAAATSGHPLLRAAAVEAARASKFTPTQLSGQPVKVTGIIVYNFVAAKASWFNIGGTLANVERVPTLQFFDSNQILKTIPADWATEKQQIGRLDELKQAEQQSAAEPKLNETVVEEKAENAAQKTRTTTIKIPRDKKMQPEQAALAQSLIASLQGRLSVSPLDLWHFTLGVELNRALAKLSAPSERQAAIETLRRHIETAPPEVAPEAVNALNNIVTVFGANNLDAAKRQEINAALRDLYKVLR